MSSIVFVSAESPPEELSLLQHELKPCGSAAEVLTGFDDIDVVVVDGRRDLSGARSTCQALARGGSPPVLLLVASTGLAVVSTDWGFADFVTAGCEPAELDARIRVLARSGANPDLVTFGPLRLDGSAYSVTLDGTILDLTYTEFELLHYLMQHPGKVLSRETLVSQVWGYDYYGGTRTVDVHVRRLRAKLGQYDYIIATVRNVGYRFGNLVPRR